MAAPPDKLPTVVSDIPRDLRAWTERVRETLADVQAAAEATNTTTINYYGPGGGGSGNPNWQPGDPLPCGYPVTPSAPANLRVDAGFGFFSLTWDAPAYCGHSYTEVYGLPNDDLGAAILLGSSVGTSFSHVITEPGAFWYFWLRHINVLGLPGPYNQTQGTGARTALDPDYLLDLLQGQITESQLFTSLAQRIDGIEPLQVDMAVVQDDLAGLSVQYTVKIDAGNHIAGFGLASTPAAEGGNTSRFIVRADEFAIAGATTISATAPTSPYIGQAWLNTTTGLVYYWTGSAWSTDSSSASVPFVVRTAPTTLNGETVPAGVYLTDAYIGNGTITTAKIGNATITDAKILSLTASKLTAGTMAVDTYIQSGNYNSSNLTGWKLWTDASGAGYAEFNGGATGAAVTVRGSIYADKGWFKGCILGGSASQYAVGTGFYAGFGDACATSGTYKFRVGTAANQRMVWDDSNLEVYDSSNTCVMRIGAANSFFLAKDSNGITRVRFGSEWGDSPGLRVYDANGSLVMDSDGSFNGWYLDNSSVGTAAIADAAITEAKIDNLAVTNAKIANLAVTTLKIANNAVTIPVALRYYSYQGMVSSSVSFIAPAEMKAIITVSLKPKPAGASYPSMVVSVIGATTASATIEGWQYAGDYYLAIVDTYLVTLNAGINTFSVRPTNADTATDTFITLLGAAK